MLGSLPALALLASFLVSGAHGETTEEELDKVELFTGVGKSSAYQNTWGGWYSDKPEYKVEVENGDGKREAYDSAPLEVLIFSDDSGREVAYRLEKRFQGKTLLQIVQRCMGEDRVNIQSNLWESGHCTIGDLERPFNGPQLMDPFATVSEHLRIGVGDGMGDPTDWCLFMPEEGNSGGDFAGLNAFCFGSEDETNTGYPGKVTIQGGVKKAKTTSLVVRMRITWEFAWTADAFVGKLEAEVAKQLVQMLQGIAQEVAGTSVVTVTPSETPVLVGLNGVNLVFTINVNLPPSKHLQMEVAIHALDVETLSTELELELRRLVYGSDCPEERDQCVQASLHDEVAAESPGDNEAPASPWPDAAPAEGSSKAVVAVVGSSVFLTACPFVCASLWCFCRQNREGGSNSTSKAGKKGVSGVDAESDIISMIEEMGDAPVPLTVHSPVCVTLSNGTDTPASPSSWRVK